MSATVVASIVVVEHEVARGSISHPDAGKTTLRARKNQRRATSGWMALKQWAVSVAATALQFEYHGMRLDLRLGSVGPELTRDITWDNVVRTLLGA